MNTDGADNETRTRDPNLGKVVLYQLSYVRILIKLVRVEGLEPPTFSLSARRSNQAEPHPCIGHDGDRCRVGVTGLEPATLRSQSGRATKLRHTPSPGPAGRLH